MPDLAAGTSSQQRVPHDLGDPLLSIWTLWWNARVRPLSDEWWVGLAFFPAGDTLTLSDHRLGFWPMASPLIWLGASPVTAYNVLFLGSFVASAAAAHALAFVLTRRVAAAVIAGLVFGFHPFRAEHLAHLELLSGYWLPVLFVALHQWTVTERRRWLSLAAMATTMQALTSGYYMVFGVVLVGLWAIWFRPLPLAIRQWRAVAAALAAPALVLAPILVRYRQAHHAMGLSRTIAEIEHYSADAVGLLTVPAALVLWRSPESWQRPEGALFPGLTAVALVAAALARTRERRSGAMGRLRRVLLASGVVAVAASLLPLVFGPLAFELAGVRLSVSHPDKPLSIAAILFALVALTSPAMRRAWHARSSFAFFALATLAMWLLALGPTGRLLGEPVLYKAPYAWLMLVPGFGDELRVPARFGMLAALTLSAAASLAFVRLLQRTRAPHRLRIVLVLGAAIVAESWIEPLPLHPPPVALDVPAAVPREAVIAELPSGLLHDAAAMYR